MAETGLSTLVRACLHASIVSKKFKTGDALLKCFSDIKDTYMSKKRELIEHENDPSVSKALESFNEVLAKAESQLESWRGVKFFADMKHGGKVNTMLKELESKWGRVMMALTLRIAETSTEAADKASGNVAKLAIAAGHPDWEVLNEEEAVAICTQGDKYLFGFGVPQSYDTAFKRYMAAARYGLAEACNMVACMHERGLGREVDLPAAVHWYTTAAEKHSADALNNLGRLHETGKGVKTDLDLAAEFYMRAGHAGHSDALTNLGYLYEMGLVDGRPDFKMASHWYKNAAMQGYARAENCMGSLYYAGRGVELNYTSAVEWFRRGAAQGHAPSQNNLGICYEEGKGVPRDLSMAKQMYQLAAQQEHGSAMNNLGYMYMLEGNYDDADRWFRLAAAKGSLDALFNIATMYEDGMQPDGPSPRTAHRFFLKAAQEGYTKAQNKVGLLHFHGNGAMQSYGEAAYWFAKSATSGDAEGQYHLGSLYEAGLGVEQSDDEAVHWYSQSHEGGNVSATVRLAEMHAGGIGVARDTDAASRLLAWASRQGNIQARNRLAELQDNREDVAHLKRFV